MRALTLTQPWAGLVASGIKLVENRPRPMIKREDFGKPFAIHASREINESVYNRIAEIAPDTWTVELQPNGRAPDAAQPWYQRTRITSAVIAVATVHRWMEYRGDVEPMLSAVAEGELPPDQRRWFFGPVGYVLRDVRALATPVPCKGRLGFWTLPADVARQVEEQLR